MDGALAVVLDLEFQVGGDLNICVSSTTERVYEGKEGGKEGRDEGREREG
jgi:hypothetical protein